MAAAAVDAPERASRTRWTRWDGLRAAGVASYLAIIVICLVTPWGPRVFWTMALPLLIVGIVLVGFHGWRRVCPLAFWASLGLRLKPKSRAVRRAPAWLDRWFFLVTLGFLVAMLSIRLLFINGDGLWLAVSLVALGVFAAGVNYVLTGKSWCNFVCPVGFVERVYTDPSSLRVQANSQCSVCTACKKHCPDIDHEGAYWKDVALPARRFAFFAFPGVVLAFYSYYYLRAGNWEAYFGGGWTHEPVSRELISGAGFYFLPAVPAYVAAPLTLVLFGIASLAVFLLLERLLRVASGDHERATHLALSLAAFAAFNLFYLFAGAPTLRRIPWGVRTTAFVVPLVATIVLARRIGRSSENHLKEKTARKLLARWTFSEPPQGQLLEVFAFARANDRAHGVQLAAYRDAVGEVVVDGVVTNRDLRLLERLRADLGVAEAEHAKIVAELSEEQRDLLGPAHATSVERRLQLEGYRAALAAVYTGAPGEELTAVAHAFGVDEAVHRSALAELARHGTAVRDRARVQLERVRELAAQEMSVTAHAPAGPARDFTLLALGARKRQAVARVHALTNDLAAELEQALTPAPSDYPETLDALLRGPDRYLRAAAAALTGAATDVEIEHLLHLARIALFANLDLEDLEDISRRAVAETLPAGETLCREGEETDDFFVLTAGVATVTVGGRPIATLRAGEAVGEIAALDRSPRTATVTATGGGVSVLRLGRDDLRSMLRSHPDIADAVLATLARRLRAST